MLRFGPQTRQMVLAITIAVIAALGLAGTVTYGFSSTTSNTTSTTSSAIAGIDCTTTNPPMLNLPPNSTLKEDGTTTIGGTSYWYVSFIEGNMTTVYFRGVQFALNEGALRLPTTPGYEIHGSNATFLITKTGPGLPSCGDFLPQITITFPDSTSVVYNRETVTLTAVGANITYDKPSSNPWFSQHVSPQVGVAYQTDGGEITLYVSTS